jgi:glutaminyl-tRNA synthetase
MGVLNPIRVVIENYPEGSTEEFDAQNHPNDPAMGSRAVPFSREIYIEAEDFMEEPTKGYFRLSPGREVRLRYAYIVKCTGVVKDEATGEILEVRCSYDPESRGGSAADGRKVKGTIHWVSVPHAVAAEVRLYDRLFTVSQPGSDREGADWKSCLNPEALRKLTACRLEPGLAGAAPGSRFQFERQGYFTVDTSDSRPGAPVFNRIVTLRDSWAKSGG